jgi:hypothetical protein
METYLDQDKFYEFVKQYDSSIDETQKEVFLFFLEQEQRIQEEITMRQNLLLEEIHITDPNFWVEMILKDTR